MSGTRYHMKRVDGVPTSDAPKRTAKVKNLIRAVIGEGDPGETYLIATYPTVRGAEEAKYRHRREGEFQGVVEFVSRRRGNGTSQLYVTIIDKRLISVLNPSEQD